MAAQLRPGRRGLYINHNTIHWNFSLLIYTTRYAHADYSYEFIAITHSVAMLLNIIHSTYFLQNLCSSWSSSTTKSPVSNYNTAWDITINPMAIYIYIYIYNLAWLPYWEKRSTAHVFSSRHLSPRSPRFGTRLIHMETVVERMALRNVFHQIIRIFPVSIIPPLLHIAM